MDRQFQENSSQILLSRYRGNTQPICEDRFVEESKKKKVGYLLPREVVAAFRQACSRLGVRNKEQWLAVGAAIVLFIEVGEEAQQDAIQRIKSADLPGGSFEKLMGEVGAHKPRKARNNRLKNPRRKMRGFIGSEQVKA